MRQASSKKDGAKLRQGKYFCFTVYHYYGGLGTGRHPSLGIIFDDMPVLYYALQEQFDLGVINYAVCQEEVCPNTGRPHIQGYIEYVSNQRFVGLKGSALWEGEVVRFENARGTGAENRVYCSKKDDRPADQKRDDTHVFEIGEIRNRGKGARNDIYAVKKAIDMGEALDRVWQNEATFEPMLKYHKAFSVYEQVVANSKARAEGAEREVEVIVYWGKPGTGKSYRADRELRGLGLGAGADGALGAEAAYYSVPMPKGSGLYFDGYVGQHGVLIDEMRGSRMSHEMLLRLLDRYRCTVPVHGGQVVWVPRKIILTSNYHPFEWYRNLNVSDPELGPWRALERRLSSVVEMTEVYRAPAVEGAEVPQRRWDPPGGINFYLAQAQEPQQVGHNHDNGAKQVFVGQLPSVNK